MTYLQLDQRIEHFEVEAVVVVVREVAHNRSYSAVLVLFVAPFAWPHLRYSLLAATVTIEFYSKTLPFLCCGMCVNGMSYQRTASRIIH